MADVADSEADMVAVLLRRKPSHTWEFITYAVNKEVGWRSAAYLQQQERLILDNPKAKAIVVRRITYDRGNVMTPMKPPAGFDFGIDSDREVIAYRDKVDAEEALSPPVPVQTAQANQPIVKRRRRCRGDGDLDL